MGNSCQRSISAWFARVLASNVIMKSIKFIKNRCNGGRRSTFAGNSAGVTLWCHRFFAMLPDQRFWRETVSLLDVMWPRSNQWDSTLLRRNFQLYNKVHYGLCENSELFIILEFLTPNIHHSLFISFIFYQSVFRFHLQLSGAHLSFHRILLARMPYALLNQVTILYFSKYPELEWKEGWRWLSLDRNLSSFKM